MADKQDVKSPTERTLVQLINDQDNMDHHDVPDKTQSNQDLSQVEASKAGNDIFNSQSKVSNQQVTNKRKEPEDFSCANCKSYFPLLKSFVLHLESSHKATVENGADKYECEACDAEFDSSISLGKHSLIHASCTISSNAQSRNGDNEATQKLQERPSNFNENQEPRKRGRPRKYQTLVNQADSNWKASPRRRGRPPKRANSDHCDDVKVIILEDKIEEEKANEIKHVDGEDVALIRPRSKQDQQENGIKQLKKFHSGNMEEDEQRPPLAKYLAEMGSEETGLTQEDKVEDDSSTDSKSSSVKVKKKRNVENQCIICLEKFATKEALREHRLIHGDRDKWPCNDCNREFSSHWKFHEHCVKVHNNKKPFQCDDCGKSLSSFTILATHKGLHSGERPYVCELCGKRYLVAAGLKDHMVAHKNEREHRCDQCGAGFNAKGDLKKHLITHMTEKPHNCDVCKTGFNRAASLRRHMRSHTGEKPFKCDLCEKAFSRKEKMHEHRRTHTGERPLVCPTCGKTFKDSSNFSNHKKIHNKDYIPRKRKRVAIMKKTLSDATEVTSEGKNVASEINIASNQVTETASNDTDGQEAQKTIEMSSSGGDSTLKDFATISMATEGLHIAGQELFRQILGAAFDPADLRHVLSTHNAAGNTGSLFNLSPLDVRSLQLIINGAQSRNTVTTTASTSGNVSETK